METFKVGYRRDIERRADELRAYRADGKRVVIWGAGSKGVAYLTTLGEIGGIDVAVDVNPHKQGMFLAGTGKRTIAPAELLEVRPDVVIAMNPVYLAEIRASMDALGLDATLVPCLMQGTRGRPHHRCACATPNRIATHSGSPIRLLSGPPFVRVGRERIGLSRCEP